MSDEREWGIEAAGDHPAATHIASFSDWIAHEREDLVQQAARYLADLPGVDQALHEDREVILITAPGLSEEELSGRFAEWWHKARRSAPPWQELLKGHAAAAHSVLKPLGFRKRNHTFNRHSDEDVWQVVELRRLDDEVGRIEVGLFIESIVEPLGLRQRHSEWINEVECHIRDPFGGRHHFQMQGDSQSVAELITTEIVPGLESLRHRRGIRAATADGERKLGMHRPANHVVAALAALDGDMDVAQRVMQQTFEEAGRRGRNAIHGRAANLGLEPLTTGDDRTLTAQEEADLQKWRATQHDRLSSFQALIDANPSGTRRLLRTRPGDRIDLSVGRSAVPDLWRWMLHWAPRADDILRGEPLPHRYVGYSFDELTVGQRLLAELLATFIFEVVADEVPNASWVLDDDAAFAVSGARSETIISRAQQIINDVRNRDHRAHDPKMHQILSHRIDWIVERIG